MGTQLQDKRSQHPPHEKQSDDGAYDVDNPIASGLGLPEVEHRGIVTSWFAEMPLARAGLVRIAVFTAAGRSGQWAEAIEQRITGFASKRTHEKQLLPQLSVLARSVILRGTALGTSEGYRHNEMLPYWISVPDYVRATDR